MQVEPLAGGVRGQQDALPSGRELAENTGSLGGGQTAMQLTRPEMPEFAFQCREGVPVLRKHDRRLAGSTQQTCDRAQLAFSVSGATGEREKPLERIVFVTCVLESWRPHFNACFFIIGCCRIQWQRQLPVDARVAVQERKPAFDAAFKRAGAAAGPAGQDDHGERRRRGRRVSPDPANVGDQCLVHPSLDTGRLDSQPSGVPGDPAFDRGPLPAKDEQRKRVLDVSDRGQPIE